MSASVKASHLRIVGDRSLAELSDPALVDALLRREPWAAEMVWRRHSARVFELISHCLGFRADADALTQQAFLRLFARVELLEEPRALTSVLYSCAVHHLLWELWGCRIGRWFGHRRSSAYPEDVIELSDGANREAICAFYELLDELAPTDRILLVLRHVEGFHAVEIAEVMGWTLRKVQLRVRRALARARQIAAQAPGLEAYLSPERAQDAQPWLEGA